MTLALDAFLTAYDPSDLPGASIDPLGFDRAYTYLADKFLPGLTNVASAPRYLSMLCAGASLCRADAAEPDRKLREARRDTILRFERVWVLANALASKELGRPSLPLRGVSYADSQIQDLDEEGARKTSPDFRMLDRQASGGALGIYGAIAERMKLLDRRRFDLMPGSGEVLAQAFLAETDLPATIRRAIETGDDVSLSTLTDWGKRAFIQGRVKAEEARQLGDCLHLDERRSRTADVLARHPSRDGEWEQDRLRRIHGSSDADPELKETIAVILALEECYAHVQLGFERVLFCARTDTVVNTAALAQDSVLSSVAKALPAHERSLRIALDQGVTRGEHHAHLGDLREFLAQAASATDDIAQLVGLLIARHRAVQSGKFDQGRRKTPWLDEGPGGLSLGATRVGGLRYEATSTDQILRHEYRTRAADNFINASMAAGQS